MVLYIKCYIIYVTIVKLVGFFISIDEIDLDNDRYLQRRPRVLLPVT